MYKKLMLSMAFVFGAAFATSPALLATGGGGNKDCRAGTELAKYEFNGSAYIAESGADTVTITNGDANGGDFTVTDSTKEVTAVIVKGSTDANTDTYPNGVSSGSFDNNGLQNNGGNTPDVSNVKFCGGVKTDDNGGGSTTPPTDNDGGSTTPPTDNDGGSTTPPTDNGGGSTTKPNNVTPQDVTPQGQPEDEASASTQTQAQSSARPQVDTPKAAVNAGGGSIIASIVALSGSLATFGFGLRRLVKI